jgi:hypothetical protein
MKPIILSTILFLLLPLTTLYALVPEPDVTIFGTIYNHYKGADTILHNGTMTWIIKANDNNQESYQYTTKLETLNGGQYSYQLSIPQKVAGDLSGLPSMEVSDFNSDKLGTIFVDSKSDKYEHISISIDGHTAQIKEAARTSLYISQALRSQIVQIDLILSVPPKRY